MSAFKTEVDIANRALQHLRVRRIRGFSDSSLASQECAFAYARLREAELKEHLWRFSTRRTILYPAGPASYLWTPPTFSAGTTYALGAVVVDSTGDWWQARKASVTSAPAQGGDWEHYFGPDSLVPFVAPATSTLTAPVAPTLTETSGASFGPRTVAVRLTYVGAAGESLPSAASTLAIDASNLLVVTSPAALTGATSYNVYAGENADGVVLQNSSPITIGTPWDEPSTGIAPNGAFPPVSSAAFYFAGDLVSLAGQQYISRVTNNTDTPPSVNWVTVGGTIAPLVVFYPIGSSVSQVGSNVFPVGSGPSTDKRTANVFRLPHGYLRQAPTEPKKPAYIFLGVPTGHYRDDWVFEGNYLVSASIGPILMRYVADMVDVPAMDATFCEMLSARIATEIGPLVVDDRQLLPTLLAGARAHYESERQTATSINMIEIGPIEMEVDDYLTVRY